jgi:ribosomal protein S18 acetylase RimI-like enzyme
VIEIVEAGPGRIEVLERVREAGATHLGLTAVATNDGALRFYRRHGFAPAFVEMVARL